MEAEIILLIISMSVIGSAIGTFTGLVPGIHVNTLSALMLASYPALKEVLILFVPESQIPICLSSVIVSASVVHSFVDYVPSVFIGAPDPDDVMSMLPGHRLLSEGRGMAAVRAAAIGSCVGTCSAVLIAVPLQYLLMNGLGDYFDSITAGVLILVVVVMLMHERDLRSMVTAASIMLLSGALGLAVMDLDIPSEGLLGEGTLLFPLLTGLFGIPTMLQSLNNSFVAEQTDDERYPIGPIPGIKGLIVGMITGWFPGITATTGAVIAGTAMPERTPEGFISMTASIGSAAAVVMIVTMSVTGKGRSGTMLNVCEILGDNAIGFMNGNFLLLLLASATAALLGYHITISCGKMMTQLISKIDSSLLNRICLIVVVVLVFLMTGPFGIMILILSTMVGFLPILFGVGRIHLTGCLIIPTLLTYLGLRVAVLILLSPF